MTKRDFFIQIIKLFGLFSVVTSLFSVLYGQEDPCNPKILCTEIYVLHSVGLTDLDGCPVILDEYISRNIDTGKVLEKWKFNPNDDLMNNHLNIYKNYARYLLLGDNRKDQISRGGTKIRFVGKKNGKVIVDREFLVGHDCCHVTFLEGDRNIKIGVTE